MQGIADSFFRRQSFTGDGYFLIIDMVVASVLMSMGMLMMSPVMIALPFKLMLFVLADGWHLVVGSLLNGFAA